MRSRSSPRRGGGSGPPSGRTPSRRGRPAPLPPRSAPLPETRRPAPPRLPRDAWNFGAGGAESETTLRRNRRALGRLAITQNILVDVRQIDLSTSLLGVP